MSAIRTFRPGGSRRPSTRRARSTSIVSSPARTSTALWCATSRRSFYRRHASTISACCRSSRSPAVCSPANTSAAPEDTRFGKSPALRDRYVTPRNEDIVEKLQAFAQARGHSMLELAFSWLASRPQVSSVIAGATRVEQVEQNVKAIDWALSAGEIAEIDAITKG